MKIETILLLINDQCLASNMTVTESFVRLTFLFGWFNQFQFLALFWKWLKLVLDSFPDFRKGLAFIIGGRKIDLPFSFINFSFFFFLGLKLNLNYNTTTTWQKLSPFSKANRTPIRLMPQQGQAFPFYSTAAHGKGAMCHLYLVFSPIHRKTPDWKSFDDENPGNLSATNIKKNSRKRG